MNRIQIRRTTRRPHSPDDIAMPANAWRSILELGRLAPTPHNTQWYFVRVVDSRTAHVCIDESIAIPFTDPNDQFRYTGLGVFTRHLEVAARAAGFELHTTFDDLDPSGPVVARIVGRRPLDEALSVLLRTRQTSRFAYGDHPVSAAAIEAVQAITDRHSTLTMTTDPRIVLAVLELNNELLLADLHDKGTSRELDSWTVHRTIPPTPPERLHAGVVGDPGVEDLGRVPAATLAGIRCRSALAHHPVPVAEPCRDRRVDLRTSRDSPRPVPGGQDPDGCVDHPDGARLLPAAVWIDHHRRRRTGAVVADHRRRRGSG
jgi:hypothetical protein